jgi:hypothetical protein
MSRVTAAEIKAMSKSHSGNEPHKYHVEAILGWIGPDEKLLWCADFVDMAKRFGTACLLAVTDRRVVLQRIEGTLAKRPDVYEIAIDDVLRATDFPKPVMFGLMTNHHLVVEATTGQLVIQDMADRMVASSAAAINAAKLGP